MNQCEVCDNEFEPRDSDAHEPQKFCSNDCEQEREERVRVFQNDWELQMDLDCSMNY